MGYTHYFEFNKSMQKKGDQARYNQAIYRIQKMVRSYYMNHKGTEKSIAGVTAHTVAGTYRHISLNGKGVYACEEFYLPEKLEDLHPFQFCKTRKYYYDKLVVGALTILTYYLPHCIYVDSDGEFVDWIDGITLAEKTTRLKLVKHLQRENAHHPIVHKVKQVS